jgi:hypothetical protein
MLAIFVVCRFFAQLAEIEYCAQPVLVFYGRKPFTLASFFGR